MADNKRPQTQQLEHSFIISWSCKSQVQGAWLGFLLRVSQDWTQVLPDWPLISSLWGRICFQALRLLAESTSSQTVSQVPAFLLLVGQGSLSPCRPVSCAYMELSTKPAIVGQILLVLQHLLTLPSPARQGKPFAGDFFPYVIGSG